MRTDQIKKDHPELLEGEVFLTNASDENFGSIGWLTKRMGVVAYDISGKRIKGVSLYLFRGRNW